MTRNNTPSSKEENLLVFTEISSSIYRICYFWILLILLLYCLGSESQRYSMNGLWISMPVPVLAMALELQVCRYIISHKFWDQSPFPYYQCCLQVSETVSRHKLWCCYSANMLQYWVGGRDLIYFCKVDHSRISINFPGIDLVSIIYVRYCHKIWGS